MEQYITAGLIGSLVTIIIQAIINAISDRVKHKRELRTMVFQRKLEVVEKAMSWYQETLDMYYMPLPSGRTREAPCRTTRGGGAGEYRTSGWFRSAPRSTPGCRRRRPP